MNQNDALNLLLADVRASGFRGDIESDVAARIVAATDNSIYQLPALAIFYPAQGDDINRVMRCVHEHRHQGFSITARGGGTGTNGQSLSDNLILDCSRYLDAIGELDLDTQTITVEPGVVLDQLNRHLQHSELFFPIDISSSSRATIGGMVATDASGKGSLIYGKTSRHVLSLDVVMSDGRDYHAAPGNPVPVPGWENILQKVSGCSEEIDRVFPVMDRGLTGYNLQQFIEDDATFNPCYLLSGSEGTLAISKKITLRLSPRPTHKMLGVIFYDDFQQALEHVQVLLQTEPAAIEMLDDKILDLAKTDPVWNDVSQTLDGLPSSANIKATNFIEFSAFSATELRQREDRLTSLLQQTGAASRVIHFETETDAQRISALWNLRKRAVGLLGKLADNKKGVAFVEDTAVPPQNLAAYVTDFRKVLDEHHLEYGMYGHADAGVLHVRPALDLMQPSQRDLIRKLSDIVARLAHKHGGVLWGEHGRGFRGEYTPLFFGKKLYPLLCDIKKCFDPYNCLNPGKLTTPEPSGQLTALDQVAMRAAIDSDISKTLRVEFSSALSCNGNGACYNADLSDAMCPSYKATKNKIYSPKGRAALLREWSRLQSAINEPVQLQAIESALFDSLQHCLSCQSCTSQCPVNVDIPEMKSRFLAQYYQHQSRPLSHLFVRHFETLLASGRRFPRITNLLLQNRVIAGAVRTLSRLDRLPTFSTASDNPFKTYRGHQNLAQNTVILLRDNYIDSFDRNTLHAAGAVLQKLGFVVYLSEPVKNGKLLHVKGYRPQFAQQAQRVVAQIQQLSRSGLPLISCETVTRQMFGNEYAKILQQEIAVEIHSIESFILQALKNRSQPPAVLNHDDVTLLPHCIEQTAATDAPANWQQLFRLLGIDLTIKNAGCCGMSGQFGHEVENQSLSQQIYHLMWQPTIESSSQVLLASGFSCRCQAENHRQTLLHPVVYLHQILH